MIFTPLSAVLRLKVDYSLGSGHRHGLATYLCALRTEIGFSSLGRNPFGILYGKQSTTTRGVYSIGQCVNGGYTGITKRGPGCNTKNRTARMHGDPSRVAGQLRCP